MRKIFLLVCAIMIFVSCENSSIGNVELNENNKRKWTTIVYMAADNNLESAGIDDLKELESVNLNGSKMTVLVLLDRADGYDERIGNWTDTRLFEVKYDSKFDKRTIASKRLDCKELGLSASEETELDMGKIETLSGVIDFAKRKYEAEHYALVMWGHGNGLEGTAFDDKTNTSLTIPDMRNAIEGKGLDVVAFDTCFGGVIEIFYEMKDSAEYLVGAAGRVPNTGFNYTTFLELYKSSDKSPVAFSNAIAKSASVPVSVAEATKMGDVANAVNELSVSVAKKITTRNERDIAKKIFVEQIYRYEISENPGDRFIDLLDYAKKYSECGTSEIENCAKNLISALEDSVGTTNSNPAQIGIYFGRMANENTVIAIYPDLYVHDGFSNEKARFVQEMSGWVPTKSKDKSLLDKLFRTNLNDEEENKND